MEKMVIRSICPLCSSQEIKDYRIVKNIKIAKCYNGGYVFLKNIDLEYLKEIYKKNYYPSSNSPQIQEWINKNRTVWQEIVNNIISFKYLCRNLCISTELRYI